MIYSQRDWYQQVQSNPDRALRDRAPWMTDTQWFQLEQYCLGKAIPTDAEIIEGLRYCTPRHLVSRSAGWMYFHVSDFVANEPNYTYWCNLILEHYDPDMLVDEGL